MFCDVFLECARATLSLRLRRQNDQASTKANRLLATCVIDAPLNGALFRACIEQFCLLLWPPPAMASAAGEVQYGFAEMLAPLSSMHFESEND